MACLLLSPVFLCHRPTTTHQICAHVFLEKVFCMSSDTCNEMIDLPETIPGIINPGHRQLKSHSEQAHRCISSIPLSAPCFIYTAMQFSLKSKLSCAQHAGLHLLLQNAVWKNDVCQILGCDGIRFFFAFPPSSPIPPLTMAQTIDKGCQHELTTCFLLNQKTNYFFGKI